MGMITACSLDCPDSCSLEATVEDGVLVALDAAADGPNPSTNGWICAKVKHTPQLLHGPDRITTPLRRVGRKGAGEFVETTWDEALDLFADKVVQAVAAHGWASVVPYLYNSSAGKMAQAGLSPLVWEHLGAARTDITICAAVVGEAWQRTYGSMPSADPQDLEQSRADRGVGCQSQRLASPSVAGDRTASACRGAVGRRRPATHPGCRSRRSAPGRSAGHRRCVGDGRGRAAAAQRSHRSAVHRALGRRCRAVPRRLPAVDPVASRRGVRRGRVRHRVVRRDVRHDPPGDVARRLGAGAESQRGIGQPRRVRPAGVGRAIRCCRRGRLQLDQRWNGVRRGCSSARRRR